jgi:hypothetical protein
MESVCDSMCFTDVTIITASDRLRAHRSVLAAHSTFLAYLLAGLHTSNNTASDTEEPVLHFPHYPSLYVRMLLQFFYTGMNLHVLYSRRIDKYDFRSIRPSVDRKSKLAIHIVIVLSCSVVDPDPQGSETFCRIRIRNSRLWIRIRMRNSTYR